MKSYNTLHMLVVLFCFFQKLMRRTTALVNWADQHEKGRAVEVLVMEAMSKLKAAMRKMVEIPQK